VVARNLRGTAVALACNDDRSGVPTAEQQAAGRRLSRRRNADAASEAAMTRPTSGRCARSWPLTNLINFEGYKRDTPLLGGLTITFVSTGDVPCWPWVTAVPMLVVHIPPKTLDVYDSSAQAGSVPSQTGSSASRRAYDHMRASTRQVGPARSADQSAAPHGAGSGSVAIDGPPSIAAVVDSVRRIAGERPPLGPRDDRALPPRLTSESPVRFTQQVKERE
jgi:hypothetical protein